jgi:hypothetical protein
MSKKEALSVLEKKYGHGSVGDGGRATDKALRREIAKRRARGAHIPESL